MELVLHREIYIVIQIHVAINNTSRDLVRSLNITTILYWLLVLQFNTSIYYCTEIVKVLSTVF